MDTTDNYMDMQVDASMPYAYLCMSKLEIKMGYTWMQSEEWI